MTAAGGTLAIIKDTESMGHSWVRSRTGARVRVIVRTVDKVRVRIRVRG